MRGRIAILLLLCLLLVEASMVIGANLFPRIKYVYYETTCVVEKVVEKVVQKPPIIITITPEPEVITEVVSRLHDFPNEKALQTFMDDWKTNHIFAEHAGTHTDNFMVFAFIGSAELSGWRVGLQVYEGSIVASAIVGNCLYFIDQNINEYWNCGKVYD